MRSGNMPKSLYQNWQFAIEVNGFDVALFRKGTEPKTESRRRSSRRSPSRLPGPCSTRRSPVG